MKQQIEQIELFFYKNTFLICWIAWLNDQFVPFLTY